MPYGVARATDPKTGQYVVVATKDPVGEDFYTLNGGPQEEIPADVIELARRDCSKNPAVVIAIELLWRRLRLMEPAEQEELTLP